MANDSLGRSIVFELRKIRIDVNIGYGTGGHYKEISALECGKYLEEEEWILLWINWLKR